MSRRRGKKSPSRRGGRAFRRESYSNGTGTGQADIAWSDRLTVTSTLTVDIGILGRSA